MKAFKEIHNMIGGNIKLFISGAASLNKTIEEKYRLLGINLVQGYGLTETSPVVGIGTNKYYRIRFNRKGCSKYSGKNCRYE